MNVLSKFQHFASSVFIIIWSYSHINNITRSVCGNQWQESQCDFSSIWNSKIFPTFSRILVFPFSISSKNKMFKTGFQAILIFCFTKNCFYFVNTVIIAWNLNDIAKLNFNLVVLLLQHCETNYGLVVRLVW